MIRIVNVKEEIMITVSVVSDISYAWEIIDNYVGYVQEGNIQVRVAVSYRFLGIKQDPRVVIKLRSLVLKLSSILDLPLVRINQAGSADLISVSEYYSSELVSYPMNCIYAEIFLIIKVTCVEYSKSSPDLCSLSYGRSSTCKLIHFLRSPPKSRRRESESMFLYSFTVNMG